MEATAQRRAAPRIGRPLMVRYRRNAEALWRPATLKDVSRDGARLLSEEVFEPAQSLELQFGLPWFPEPVEIVGRVAWKKPLFSGQMQITEYGFLFTTFDVEFQLRLEAAVQRFFQQSSPKKV